MSNEAILFIRLEGPLQSWGERSKWNSRDTAQFPTKSGVIGLIGCALGIERNSPELGRISKELIMACRADRRGEVIDDFQTVSSNILRTADGGKRSTPTIITNKKYLQDSSFLVGLQGHITLLERIRDGLLNPKWPPFLGRKSCIPSVPLLASIEQEYISLFEAMKEYPLARRHDSVILVEYEVDKEPQTVRMDERFESNQMEYGSRWVNVCTLF